ncbi:MAG: OmpA family protein [Chthonomonas sp.]|nr:OmpA family protein [Chthonomonas sp.]
MSLLESLKSLVTPELLARASEFLGEGEANLSKGLSVGLPAAVLQAGSHAPDSPALTNAFDILGKIPTEDPVRAAQGQDAGTFLPDFLKSILGDKADAMSKVLGEVSGVKGAASGGLIALIGGLLMNFLGGKMKTDGLNPAGLVDMVGKEKGALLSALPAGLAGMFGGGADAMPKIGTATAVAAGSPVMATTSGLSETRSNTRWVAPALLAIFAIGGFLLFQSCQKSRAEGGGHGEETSTASHEANPNEKIAMEAREIKKPTDKQGPPSGQPAGDMSPAMAQPIEGQPGMVNLSLPGGMTITASDSGIETSLVNFIMDSTKPVDKTTWFNFDRLTFDTGKATLKPESDAQLKNMVAILKAFPNVSLKIGGYTDNVGDPAMNLKLSGERAKNVMMKIVTMGVAADRLDAEGYGEQHPEASNDTEEGRAQNRRIAARVSAK